MASTGADQPPAAAQGSPQQPIVGSRTDKESTQEELSSSPVEMRTLPPSGAVSAATNTAHVPDTTSTAHTETAVPYSSETTSAPTTSSVKPALPTNLTRAETEAIGPSTDTPAAIPDASNGPVVVIMLLLPSTGARHPYKIDEKYLKKRNVLVDNMDPYNISVGTLKDLIWRDWREGTSIRTDAHMWQSTGTAANLTLRRMGTSTYITEFDTTDTLRPHAG
jgi:hypothetical protein